ncbi:hypothetical protein [Brevibacillus borstelensis]|uniref:hypothetical protein n=1 Tax=Brevibacillus borstelensis TaxID=45462 RepID=UPI0030BF9349
MRPLQQGEEQRQPFLSFALVSPAGKVIAYQEPAYWPGYISPFRNGYGFFKTGDVFKFSEYIIYDKQGNIQKLSCYDNSLSQLAGELFLYQREAGQSYLYNARTKTSIRLAGEEQWWSIPDQYTGKIAFDIQHYPFVQYKKSNGMITSYKFGLKDLHGNVTCKPFSKD